MVEVPQGLESSWCDAPPGGCDVPRGVVEVPQGLESFPAFPGPRLPKAKLLNIHEQPPKLPPSALKSAGSRARDRRTSRGAERREDTRRLVFP